MEDLLLAALVEAGEGKEQGPRRVIQSQWVARDSVSPAAPRETCPENAPTMVKELLGS